MNENFASCLEKQRKLKALFADCPDQDAIYQKIMDLGKEQAQLDFHYKIPENMVSGCQSTVYLRAYKQGDAIFFEAEADALISAGLAMLLIKAYSGETPETVLKCPPTFIEELGLSDSLTPNRANGLYSIHLRMKQEALAMLMRS